MSWAKRTSQVEVDAGRAHLWEVHGLDPARLQTELNPFRMPLDETQIITRGAIDFPWVSNALLTTVRAVEVEVT